MSKDCNILFQFDQEHPYQIYDMRNQKGDKTMMFIYPRGGMPADTGDVPAWPGSLQYEGWSLHNKPAYIFFEGDPNDLYVWGLRFIKKRLLEPVTFTLQHARDNEEWMYKDNSK